MNTLTESKNVKFAELFNYIKESQPQMLEWDREDLERFISYRVKTAHNEYLSVLSEKKDFQLADEIEHEVLYIDIKFSPVMFIKMFFYLEMNKDIDIHKALEYYKETKDIFEKYLPNDDLIGSDNEILLTNDLKTFFENKKL